MYTGLYRDNWHVKKLSCHGQTASAAQCSAVQWTSDVPLHCPPSHRLLSHTVCVCVCGLYLSFISRTCHLKTIYSAHWTHVRWKGGFKEGEEVGVVENVTDACLYIGV